MSLKCNLGIHEWKQDCEKCSVCGKTRSEVHDWRKDCENCRKCGKGRAEAHAFSGCVCAKCGTSKHDFREFSCSRCGQADFRGMLSAMYRLGRRCDIIGFIDCSEDQYVAKLNQLNKEADKVSFVGDRHQYLAGVIKQMFNPPIYSGDVDNLNQIARAINRASTSQK